MYAETGLLFPYFQNAPQDFQQLEEFCRNQVSTASMNNLVEASMISEYDLGGDWDLFKAPEPIIEEPVLGLDPMAAFSMMSVGEDVISSQGLKAADIESLQSEQLLDDAFYDKDILEKDPAETPLSEVLDIKMPDMGTDGIQVQEDKPLRNIQFQKSGSSGCLSSMEWMQGASTNPNFMELPGMDFATAYGIRRAFSEGDIKTLGSCNISLVHPPLERSIIITNCTTEARMEKLSRYRNKKSKRNFGRKIKYACRKALADNQPRIRGRFAKTEESTHAKRQ
ncbi:zinc finger protein HD1 isoform X2 [Argentina anserina]|uniref:zinc finger protein HD1 isoform X2 n=1 Tax=Argentina anserina TaxID=57926 RepID=UPI0021766276|nr:zinc finger protein HD1 isoform X2 [Potentilla anserina]